MKIIELKKKSHTRIVFYRFFSNIIYSNVLLTKYYLRESILLNMFNIFKQKIHYKTYVKLI